MALRMSAPTGFVRSTPTTSTPAALESGANFVPALSMPDTAVVLVTSDCPPECRLCSCDLLPRIMSLDDVDQVIVHPPVTSIVHPVIYEDCADARKTTASAISPALPSRFSGMVRFAHPGSSILFVRAV